MSLSKHISLLFVTLCTLAQAQTDTTQADTLLLPFAPQMPVNGPVTQKMIGLNPVFEVGKHKYLGGEVAIYNLTAGGPMIGITGFSAGYHRAFGSTRETFSLSAFSAVWFVVTGADLKLNFNWQRFNQKQAFGLRPEIGLALGPIYFNYGYNFVFSDPERLFNRHSLIITTYLPFIGL